MHTIDRKRWFCIPPGPPRRATGDGAASARTRPRPRFPESGRTADDGHTLRTGFPHAAKERERCKDPHAPDGGKRFPLPVPGKASHTPGAYQRQRHAVPHRCQSPARVRRVSRQAVSWAAAYRRTARKTTHAPFPSAAGPSGRREALRAKIPLPAPPGRENRRRTRGTGIFCLFAASGIYCRPTWSPTACGGSPFYSEVHLCAGVNGTSPL